MLFHHQNITLTCAKYNRNFSTYYTLPNLDSVYYLIWLYTYIYIFIYTNIHLYLYLYFEKQSKNVGKETPKYG